MLIFFFSLFLEVGAKRAVLHGGVPLLLNMFVDWHRIDHRHRQTQLRKAILNVIKLIVMISKYIFSKLLLITDCLI